MLRKLSEKKKSKKMQTKKGNNGKNTERERERYAERERVMRYLVSRTDPEYSTRSTFGILEGLLSHPPSKQYLPHPKLRTVLFYLREL